MTQGFAIRKNDGQFMSAYRRSRFGQPIVEWGEPHVFETEDEAKRVHTVLGGQFGQGSEPSGETSVVAVVMVDGVWSAR